MGLPLGRLDIVVDGVGFIGNGRIVQIRRREREFLGHGNGGRRPRFFFFEGSGRTVRERRVRNEATVRSDGIPPQPQRVIYASDDMALHGRGPAQERSHSHPLFQPIPVLMVVRTLHAADWEWTKSQR